MSLSSLKSGATSCCSIFAVELLAVGNRELHCNQASNFWESQRSCARWRTELQRHLVSTAYKTSVKKADWWKPEGFQFQLYSSMGYWYCIIWYYYRSRVENTNFLGKHNSHKTTSEKKAVAPRRHKWEDPNFRRAAFHRCIWPWLRWSTAATPWWLQKKHGPFKHGPWSDV